MKDTNRTDFSLKSKLCKYFTFYVCMCVYIYIYIYIYTHTHTYMHINTRVYTECFTTCRYYYRRWFHRSLWSKRSYKHMSDFGRLRSYGHFFIPVHALVWTASYGTSWKVMYSACWLIVCGSCNEQLAQFQPSGRLCCGRRWHFRKSALSTDKFKLKVISRS